MRDAAHLPHGLQRPLHAGLAGNTGVTGATGQTGVSL